jgi:hypothetical protein
MTTTSLDALADQSYHCEGCGCETSRLFDGDQCAVCHFAYVQDRETSINTALDLLRGVRGILSGGRVGWMAPPQGASCSTPS